MPGSAPDAPEAGAPEAAAEAPEAGDPAATDEAPEAAVEPDDDNPAPDEAPAPAAAVDGHGSSDDESDEDESDEDESDENAASTDDGFAALGLPAAIVAELEKLGYEEPTPIQAQAIVPLLAGTDVLGQAATGTGKTAAFALPMLARLAEEGSRGKKPFGLVVVPTRELAMQVSQAVHTYGRAIGASVLPVYGGQPIQRQLQRLAKGVDVVVATPGRAVDHLSRGTLDLSALRVVVLDEADEMLDMGFAEDLDAILDATPADRQTALFSATMPKRVAKIAERHLNNPTQVRIARDEPGEGTAPAIREQVVVVNRHHKLDAITRLLDVEQPTATIVFCRTRTDVDELTGAMNGRGYRAEALHGGMDQRQRTRVLDRLREGTAEVLVATDVAARGLDIDLLTHVINHSLPVAAESYVHRIGRVGRAGREGVAITLVEPRERRGLEAIERHVRRTLEVGSVPTVDDLRRRRLAQLTDRVSEAMGRDNDVVRPVLDALADDEDAVEVALAALAVLHADASGNEDDRDVPTATLYGGGKDGGSKGGKAGKHAGSAGGDGPKGKGREAYAHKDAPTGRVWLSVGRNVGVRPKDIVGAVAGETSLSGRDIGSITIQRNFSLVEVPAASVDEVVARMSKATVRGKQVFAKRDAG